MEQNELLGRAVAPLLQWYEENKRDMPWRGETDFYKILVSEIMLQQTRVEAVREYYVRFLDRFPTAHSLAHATEEEVLKAWQGLGYYNRARNLQCAAKQICENGVPKSYEEVCALKGVGEYTAGSLSSIALGLPYPAVDGNVLRILTRLFADGGKIDDKAVRTRFAQALKEVYPPQASQFCQALMELGAIVCVPNGAPLCDLCPWQAFCRAHVQGEELLYPVRSPKKERRIEQYKVLVLEYDGEYALVKRAEKGLLAGLWQFPMYGMDCGEGEFGQVKKRKKAKHVFSHIEWHMTGYEIAAREKFKQFEWAGAEEIERQYALPSAFKAFTEWLKN